MASAIQTPARGKLTTVDGNTVTFNPGNTTYQLQLTNVGKPCTGYIGSSIRGLIRVSARRIWTVSSGGNFIAPITGHPRTLQGRVVGIDGNTLTVNAAVPVLITLPDQDTAIDLTYGPIAVGAMVNVVVLPGASFEYLDK
jgi:hypothetical protein